MHVRHLGRDEIVFAVPGDIAQDPDRELLLGDLETIPGQRRYW